MPLCPNCEQPLTKEQFDASGRLYWCAYNCQTYFIEYLGKFYQPHTIER